MQARFQSRGPLLRFDRRKFFSEAPEASAVFLALFHRYGYIYKPFGGDGWLSANEKWKLTDTEILKAAACEHKQYVLGARSGKATRFAVLDIDAKSRYHNARELHRLIKQLMDAGLNEPVLYRSSYSEGWHLYIFFEQPVPAREIHKGLAQFLRSAGFVVQQGTLEVFPNPGAGSLGYGLRLPLQPGWAWLDSNTLEVLVERAALSPEAALLKFMADCRDFGNGPLEYAQFKSAIAELAVAQEQIAQSLDRALGDSTQHIQAGNELAAAAVKGVFKTPPPGIIAETWWRGRCYFESGLTGPSQRADAIFALGHYLFYGDPEKQLEPLGYGYEEERRYAVESILARKNHGHSKDLNRNRSDATAQIGRAARWLPAHKRADEITRYKKVVPISWVRHNGNLKADAITRIKAAVEELVAAAAPFKITELEQKAGCSRSTLYKHSALWKSLYLELKKLPEKSSDEYNAVVGAAAGQAGSPPLLSKPEMSPGRLAARRVVLDLMQRTDRDRQDRQWYIESVFEKYAKSWKAKVLAEKPPDLLAASARELKACVPILLSLLSKAPDEEAQIWLQSEIQIMRKRLDELRESWAGTAVQAVESRG